MSQSMPLSDFSTTQKQTRGTSGFTIFTEMDTTKTWTDEKWEADGRPEAP